jgi:hypothetical protein
MPTPPLADALEAQVVLAGTTGFARDNVVNTFHFDRAGSTVPLGTVLPLVRDALIAFYNGVPVGGGANPLCNWMSILLDRAVDHSLIKIYDLSVAAPRIPTTYTWQLGVANSGDAGLPTEVAMCLSMKTALPTRRGRGRVFVGPLHSSSIVIDPPNIHPNGGLMNSLRYAGRDLRASANPSAGMPVWSVYSRLSNQMHAVTDVWVDNEFDTQRRRGHRATLRVTA